MEGTGPERVVIAKFPSFEAAKAFTTRPNTARPVPPAKARPSCAWSASKAFDALI